MWWWCKLIRAWCLDLEILKDRFPRQSSPGDGTQGGVAAYLDRLGAAVKSILASIAHRVLHAEQGTQHVTPPYPATLTTLGKLWGMIKMRSLDKQECVGLEELRLYLKARYMSTPRAYLQHEVPEALEAAWQLPLGS